MTNCDICDTFVQATVRSYWIMTENDWGQNIWCCKCEEWENSIDDQAKSSRNEPSLLLLFSATTEFTSTSPTTITSPTTTVETTSTEPTTTGITSESTKSQTISNIRCYLPKFQMICNSETLP